RYHCPSRRADRGASRGAAMTIVGQGVSGQVARRIARDMSGRRGAAAPVIATRRLGEHCTGQRLSRLRAADRAAAGADIYLVQGFRILPELGRHLHDNVVLVLRRIDSRYLALAEYIVEGVIDLINREPEPRRAAAVDDQIRRKPVQVLVESDPL